MRTTCAQIYSLVWTAGPKSPVTEISRFPLMALTAVVVPFSVSDQRFLLGVATKGKQFLTCRSVQYIDLPWVVLHVLVPTSQQRGASPAVRPRAQLTLYDCHTCRFQSHCLTRWSLGEAELWKHPVYISTELGKLLIIHIICVSINAISCKFPPWKSAQI